MMMSEARNDKEEKRGETGFLLRGTAVLLGVGSGNVAYVWVIEIVIKVFV